MNVLHVSLGLPPLRTGGLTRYCTELMEAQVAAGDEVSLVFPGRFLPGGIRFKNGKWRGVRTYELINPLPVALTYGVAEPRSFTVACDGEKVFMQLLEAIGPDVVHVHSFMGMHLEFFRAVRDFEVPMVFTTHDYYPICPRCTLVDAWGGDCTAGPSAEICGSCCRGGMSRGKSVVMQSGLYARFKPALLRGKLAAIAKKKMASEGKVPKGNGNAEKIDLNGYRHLLEYNREIFGLFDLILTNSSVAERLYRKAFPRASYRRVRITHSGLAVMDAGGRSFSGCGEPFSIGYFGGNKGYKGYSILLAAARLLHDEGIAFDLRLFGDDYGDNPFVPEARNIGRVAPDRMGGILKELDVVVVPSICHETFGFVALEALCAGASVICSDAVGASDLLEKDAVFKAGDPVSLAERIKAWISGKVQGRGVPSGYPLSMESQVHEVRESYMTAKKGGERG